VDFGRFCEGSRGDRLLSGYDTLNNRWRRWYTTLPDTTRRTNIAVKSNMCEEILQAWAKPTGEYSTTAECDYAPTTLPSSSLRSPTGWLWNTVGAALNNGKCGVCYAFVHRSRPTDGFTVDGFRETASADGDTAHRRGLHQY
jgi:hypothetical protein